MDRPHIIPPTLEQRTHLRRTLKTFVRTQRLCPPVSLKQLEQLANDFVGLHEECMSMHPWLMVEIHNQIWLPVVAGIPHERRLLMLPKCLSRYGECKAEYDEYGLLCHRCGRCHIPHLQDKAEQLGGLSIVAEGFTQVIELIERRAVDAVIGVSCLDSLEKAFPLLVRHAVPGLAIALNDSGCRNTHVDEDYVEELLSLLSDEATPQLLDHEAIREQVSRWFTRPELEQLMEPGFDSTQKVCLDWMSGEGKRWRPFLLSAVWQALTGKTEMTPDVHRAAVVLAAAQRHPHLGGARAQSHAADHARLAADLGAAEPDGQSRGHSAGKGLRHGGVRARRAGRLQHDGHRGGAGVRDHRHQRAARAWR